MEESSRGRSRGRRGRGAAKALPEDTLEGRQQRLLAALAEIVEPAPSEFDQDGDLRLEVESCVLFARCVETVPIVQVWTVLGELRQVPEGLYELLGELNGSYFLLRFQLSGRLLVMRADLLGDPLVSEHLAAALRAADVSFSDAVGKLSDAFPDEFVPVGGSAETEEAEGEPPSN